MMKKMLFLLMFLPALAFSGVPRGEKFERRLWEDWKSQKIEKIKEYTSKEFQSNVLGLQFNRYQQLDLFRLVHLVSYTLSNIKVTHGDNSIVVTYVASVKKQCGEGTLEGTYHCLSVWKKYGDDWKWVAHAKHGEVEEQV
jgi:hypothetical protein